jgi:PKHD-type hydroxylase
MLVHIPQVLTADELAQMRARLAGAAWGDGRVTAGHQSSKAKNNLQLPEDGTDARELGAIVVRALERNPMFMAATLARHVFPPLFNKYGEGMGFGAHVDNAVRQIGQSAHRIRTDISATLFLSAPEDYDGGELVVQDTFGEHSVKLPAGDMVVYPASSLHRVEPIRRGARIASFFWIQSMVRDDGERALLFELDRTIAGIDPDSEAAIRLTAIYHNLIRKWSAM